MKHKLTLSLLALAAALLAPAAASSYAAEVPTSANEQQLIETLRTGQPAEKALACKKLAIYGSGKAVPELAKLLGDPQLSSWSRIALEVIPDKAADEALLDAAKTVKGRQLIGIVNSIGVRRSPGAVEPLAAFLKGDDADVAAAAALALGRIGGDGAAATLRDALRNGNDVKRNSAVAEGCILCAERLAAEGKADEAAEIFDEVRQAKVSQQKALEATRGAILARGDAGVLLLVEQLRASDERTFAMALMTARQLQGRGVVEAIADELQRATPARAALLLVAISDRNDARLTPALVEAARSGDKQVRIAAVGVVGRLGDAGSFPTLLEIAVDDDDEISSAAKKALAGMTDDRIDDEVLKRLPQAQGRELAVLFELVGERRIDAIDHLKKSLDSNNQAVRSAALAALGETASMQDLPVLIAQLISAKDEAALDATARALQSAAARMPDRDSCSELLAEALPDAPAPAQVKLVETLGVVGGSGALATIAATIRSGSPELQDAGSRVLGGWMTADAAPVLLELSQDPACSRYNVRLLRGYLRIARQFVLPVDERAEMCRKALDAARRPAEQELVLEILERYPAVETLQVAAQASHLSGLEQQARRVAVVIMAQLAAEGADVRDLLAKTDIQPVRVEIVKAEYGGRNVYKDVTAILAEHVGPLPMIALGAGYNDSFGGDPVPNTPKRLKVQYRIDGKPGDAVFAENEPIILPIPE